MTWRDPNFRYVPVRDQGEGYLKRRFDRIRAEQRRKDAETKAAELEREQKVEDGHKANVARSQELEKLIGENLTDRRAIKDGYESLARARKEILGRDD